jgi:hypothetical protein
LEDVFTRGLVGVVGLGNEVSRVSVGGSVKFWFSSGSGSLSLSFGRSKDSVEPFGFSDRVGGRLSSNSASSNCRRAIWLLRLSRRVCHFGTDVMTPLRASILQPSKACKPKGAVRGRTPLEPIKFAGWSFSDVIRRRPK